MRVRRELVDGEARLAVEREDRWWQLGPEHGDDLVAFLALDADARSAAAAAATAPAGGIPALPFAPRSLRCFGNWEAHWEAAARRLAQRNDARVATAIRVYEAVTRRTFPALRPGKEFYEHPVYYTGNHMNVCTDGDTVPWPSYSRLLDFELEIGFVITRRLRDATPAEAGAAIGGFVVFDDLSARDAQWDEHRNGLFGPVVKAKTFANAMSTTVVTADAVIDRIAHLDAAVRVNGEEWVRTSTAGMRYTPAEMVAHASAGEQLHAGELFTTGTLPRGCGLELDRWLQPGDDLELTVDAIGTLRTTVGTPVPAA